jgi:hypothetical protein
MYTHSTFYAKRAISMMVTLFEAKTAITTSSGARLIQIDEDFGVA